MKRGKLVDVIKVSTWDRLYINECPYCGEEGFLKWMPEMGSSLKPYQIKCECGEQYDADTSAYTVDPDAGRDDGE